MGKLKTKPCWSATVMPQARIHAIAQCRLTTMHATDQTDPRLLASARTHDASLSTGTLFWVTEAMAQLAMDASHDMPSFDYAQAPARSGMIGFSTALPALETKRIDALSWAMLGDHVGVIAWTKTTGALARSTPGSMEPSAWFWVCTDTPLEDLPATERAVLAFLNSCWVLMMTPTVAERSEHDTVNGGTPSEHHTSPYNRVTLVDLRPLREVHTTHGEADTVGRVYRHRFLVRGHWAHRAHGPGGSLRKLVYIEPFIKGPAGAPLKLTETVMVWRR